MALPPKVTLTAHRNARMVQGTTAEQRTRSAQQLAQVAGRKLLRVDLSQVVSKYSGETEKNLNRLFDQAERANSLLFFDEADAIFGKRSEVREAHDRYANLKTNLELQAADRGVPVLIGTSLNGTELAQSTTAIPLQRARKWPP
jgi:AAA+ superfamily predicted ATPase